MKSRNIFFFVYITILLAPLFIFADGGAIGRLPEGIWDWVEQNSQQAFISYQKGIEKLIIGVDFKKEFSEAAWIIPIPSKPGEVKVDIVSSLPHFYGWEVNKKAKWALSEPASYLTYPPILPLIFFVSLGGGRGAKVERSDVIVVTHLEKAGMIAEVLTAKTGQALYDYLSKKGLKIEKGSISVFNQYMGKEYSFVVSWISSEKPEELTGGERGIYITFPTKKIYYPLIPTSVYGKKEIPITIRALGYVKPRVYSEIRPYVKTEYYTRAESYSWSGALARCQFDLSQLRIPLEIYNGEHNIYPISLEAPEFRNREVEPILEDMKRNCPSFPSYQLSPNRKDYTLSIFLGGEEEYFISSTGESGKRKVLPPLELQNFYGNKEVWKGNSQYTKIMINAPSEKFNQDLWMKSGIPLRSLFFSGIGEIAAKYSWQTGIFLVALLSFLIGGILGKICFGKFKKYALVGIFNIFTIFGLILATIFIKKEESPKFSKPDFLLYFFLIYLGLSIVLGGIF